MFSGSSLLWLIFGQFFALVFVAFFPIKPLAVDGAVESLLALRAHLVLDGSTLWGLAVTAKLSGDVLLVLGFFHAGVQLV